jgi:DNA-binding XRE family transcriptional regulator
MNTIFGGVARISSQRAQSVSPKHNRTKHKRWFEQMRQEEMLRAAAAVAPTDASAALALALGCLLRRERLAIGVTQAEVARLSSIHRPIIARIERGIHTPSLSTLYRYCNAASIDARDVIEVALTIVGLA